MQSPITIRVPEEFSENLITSAEFPPVCRYKIPFATPSFTQCDFGSFLLQYFHGKDYYMELWAFKAKKNGYLDIVINRPYVSIALFMKGSLSGKLLGNGFVHAPAKSFNIFYLPAGIQRLDLPKGEYVVLIIIPPEYYLQNVAIEHSGMKDILHNLFNSKKEGSLLTSIPLPHAAWRIVKRLEKLKKEGSALDIELRRYMLELLGLYNEQFKHHHSQRFFYASTKEKAIAARGYILENLGDINLGGLNELALHFHVSQKPLTREFKLLTGKTIPQFITDERLQWAKSLLAKKEMRVFEIALIVGFSDAANFIRKFKKKFGHSPGGRNKSAAGNKQ